MIQDTYKRDVKLHGTYRKNKKSFCAGSFTVTELTDYKEIEQFFLKIELKESWEELIKENEVPLLFTAFYKNDVFCGMSWGIPVSTGHNFFLKSIKFTGGAFSKRTAAGSLLCYFGFLKEYYSIEQIFLSIYQEEGKDPLIYQILRQIPGLSVSKPEYLREFGMKTADFSYLRSFHWYHPDILEKKGVKALHWSQYPVEYKKMLAEKEVEHLTEDDYISPGISEDWEYDKDTSFVLVEKGNLTPLGWIITERVKEDTIKLRRFFIYKEARKRCLGPGFSTYVLDVISRCAQNLWFEVKPGNRQMEMFADCYCRPILTFQYMKCSFTINI